MVRDVCPPPVNNGMYYLVLDIDPGMSSEVSLTEASNPQDRACCIVNLFTPHQNVKGRGTHTAIASCQCFQQRRARDTASTPAPDVFTAAPAGHDARLHRLARVCRVRKGGVQLAHRLWL